MEGTIKKTKFKTKIKELTLNDRIKEIKNHLFYLEELYNDEIID